MGVKVSRQRWLATFVDYCWLVGFACVLTAAIARGARWSGLTHLGIPLLALPLYAYAAHRFFGATAAQYLLGLRSETPEGHRAERFYDWLFRQNLYALEPPRPLSTQIVLAVGAFVFAIGGSTVLWMRDPTLRAYPARTVPLFAPAAANAADWKIIPYFYATGAFPHATPIQTSGTSAGIEYSLPYKKGPPTQFLQQILVYWRDLDSRLILAGPLTAGKPANPDELRECVSGWLRCASTRRKIWNASIAPYLEDFEIGVNEWFAVDNGFLPAEERPQGIYLRSRPKRGRVREAYFLVGPKMAIQGFILDRPDREEGERAAARLAQVIGSLRISSDLQAPRAFINPKIAALRIGPKSPLGELVAVEALLLGKVSIEPQQSESFYHLAGLAITLYRAAKREGRIELSASSKNVVKNALRYLRDIDPKSARIPEMERFDAEVEAN